MGEESRFRGCQKSHRKILIHYHNMYANEHVKMTYFSHVYVMEGLFILIVCKDVVLSHLAFNFTKLVYGKHVSFTCFTFMVEN